MTILSSNRDLGKSFGRTMLFQPGQLILNGKYHIDAFVGQGAFAEVYRATHVTLQTTRALKVLHREMPGVGSTDFRDYQSRFQLEARLGAEQNHPNLIDRLNDIQPAVILADTHCCAPS